MEFQGPGGKASVADAGADGGGVVRDNYDSNCADVLHKKFVVEPFDSLILFIRSDYI